METALAIIDQMVPLVVIVVVQGHLVIFAMKIAVPTWCIVMVVEEEVPILATL